MAYTSNGLVQASDYNSYVGNTTGVDPNTINGFYATGNGRYGYGQPALPQVGPSDVITSAQWTNLINNITKAGNHQGTPVVTIPVTDYELGDTIITSLQGGTTDSIFAVDTAAVFQNFNNASSQGSTTTTSATTNFTWSNYLLAKFTITFDTGDKARYFFNAGGQIALNFSHPNGSGMNALWNNLCLQTGTLVISAPDNGTVNIAGTDYYGFQKIGGSGSPLFTNRDVGYYGLASNWKTLYKHAASSGLSNYLQSYIQVAAKTNGTRGSNGDVGNVITIAAKMDQVPNGGSTLLTSAGSTISLTLRAPSTSYLTNTWGNPVVTYTLDNTSYY